MTSVERGQSLPQPSPVSGKTEAQRAAVDLASRLTATLDAPGGAAPEEVGRILLELDRLPGDVQHAFYAAAARGIVGGNLIDAVQARIAEAFPVGSEKRFRLGEALARLQGADPRGMTRAALESAVARALARLRPIVPSARPTLAPPKDEILPRPDLGPFAAASLLSPLGAVSAAAGVSVPAVGGPGAASSPAPPASVAAPAAPEPKFEMKILDVTIPTITPSSPAAQPKKKKGGLFGKILSVLSVVLTILSFIFPIYAVIFRMIQMAIAAYQAIKAKNIMGLVGAVASGFGAVGTQALGQVAGAASQALSKVAEYASVAMKALQAYQAARKGDWLGALAGVGAAAAGLAQTWSGSASEALKGFAEKMQEVSNRLSQAVQVVQAARRGDFVGAIGLGASLASEIDVADPATQQGLKEVAGLADKLAPVQAAVQKGDYLAAVSSLAGIAGGLAPGPAREQLGAFSKVLERVGAAQRLVKNKDYEGAAGVLGKVASVYEGRPETKAQLAEAVRQLQQAARAFARARGGDWVGAAADMSRIVAAAQWDNETRGRLLKGSLALRRTSGIERSLKAGRYKEAAGLLTDGLSVLTGEVPDLTRVIQQLEESGRIYGAIKSGDEARVLQIIKETIEREARKPASERRPPAPPREQAGTAPPRSGEGDSRAAAGGR